MNPNYPNQVQPGASPTLGIFSLVLGVIGLFTLFPTLIFWFCGFLPFFLGIAAVIVGFLGISRIKKDPSKFSGKGLAFAGIGVGAVAIVLPTLYALLNVGYIVYIFSR